MKFAVKALAMGISLTAICLTSQAEIIPLKLAPGLWEESRITLVNGKNIEEAIQKARERMMERMTPEQRKAMMERTRPTAGTVLTCLTPAQVAKGIDTADIKRKMEESARGCKLDVISASSSGAKFKAACLGPNGNGYNGSGEYTVTNNKEWHFKMVGEGKAIGGTPAEAGQSASFHAAQEVNARWKGSDCGDVAPASEG